MAKKTAGYVGKSLSTPFGSVTVTLYPSVDGLSVSLNVKRKRTSWALGLDPDELRAVRLLSDWGVQKLNTLVQRTKKRSKGSA